MGGTCQSQQKTADPKGRKRSFLTLKKKKIPEEEE